MLEIRRLEAGEGPLLRALRLAALADSPSAFGTTLAEAEARPFTYWDDDVAGADGSGAVFLVADTGDGMVGLVRGTRLPRAEAAAVELTSMWVDPVARRAGVGRRLVEAVVEWAAVGGCRSVGLWVVRGNDAATALYRRAGFVDDDTFQAGPDDPCVAEVRMTRLLDEG